MYAKKETYENKLTRKADGIQIILPREPCSNTTQTFNRAHNFEQSIVLSAYLFLVNNHSHDWTATATMGYRHSWD